MRRILLSALLLLLAAACKDTPTGLEGFGQPRKYAVGDRVTFNVRADSACATGRMRTGRVVALTQRAVVVVDEQNPAGGFTDEEYAGFARQFDEVVYPVVTGTFGEPFDVDRNGKVVVFFTSAVNDLTRNEEGSYVGGFFFGRDLFPIKGNKALGACEGSNESEIFYMRVPDPARRAFSREEVKQTTVGVLAHEFQHLVNASRRLFVLKVAGEEWNEVVWLNEGLSHIAEELVFYRASGLAPKRNIDAQTALTAPVREPFILYQQSNFGRLLKYYEDPEANSPYQTDDDLATRGAIWHFLRYAADRHTGDETALWRTLANSTATGMANLRGALGTDPLPLFRDWSVAVYADDAVAGVPAVYTVPSWHFRSVSAAFRTDRRFPLRVRQLSNGVAQRFDLPGGGAAYLRFGVAAGGRAEVRVAAETVSTTGTCQAVNLQVGQVYTAPAGPVTVLCAEGGTTGAEFTVIPFHGTETASSRLGVSVQATGVVPVLGPPSPSLAPLGPAVALALPTAREDVAFEAELRRSEVEQLWHLVPGGSARLTRAAASGPEHLTVSIMRTK